jgi:hypothetical protein
MIVGRSEKVVVAGAAQRDLVGLGAQRGVEAVEGPLDRHPGAHQEERAVDGQALRDDGADAAVQVAAGGEAGVVEAALRATDQRASVLGNVASVSEFYAESVEAIGKTRNF